jgi:hypothetical protein
VPAMAQPGKDFDASYGRDPAFLEGTVSFIVCIVRPDQKQWMSSGVLDRVGVSAGSAGSSSE